MANGHHLVTVKEWDEEYFKEHGSFQFLTLADRQDKTELMGIGLGQKKLTPSRQEAKTLRRKDVWFVD